MMALLLALACQDPPQVEVEPAFRPLPAPRLLRRMSLDLRGILPSAAELDAVEADPSQLDALRDAWLEDPRFEDRLVDLLAERWRTRLDTYLIYVEEYSALRDDLSQEYDFDRSISDEPLRLIARVAAEGLPWSDVVTADWTMANPTMLSIWPVEATEDGEDWRKSRYTDGRPAAGVLSTNGLWIRYYTTNSNMNRGRAGVISRLLLCEDILNRPVSFAESQALSTVLGTEEALRSDPYCLGCHSSVDPLASSLFGFFPLVEYSVDEVDTYHPEREGMGVDMLGVGPAYYGVPLRGLEDLGAHIADDSRFSTCAVQTFAELYWRRATTLTDAPLLDSLHEDFVAGESRLKPLIAAITDTEEYRAGALVPDDPSSDAVLVRLIGPQQAASMVEDLTGFRWTYQGFDMFNSDTYGYRVMMGGIDGLLVTRAQQTPGLTWTMVWRSLSQAAASVAVEREQQGEATLLDDIDLSGSPSEDQLAGLWWRLFAAHPTTAQLQALSSLHAEVSAADGPEAGWAAVVEALLRDPLFTAY